MKTKKRICKKCGEDLQLKVRHKFDEWLCMDMPINNETIYWISPDIHPLTDLKEMIINSETKQKQWRCINCDT